MLPTRTKKSIYVFANVKISNDCDNGFDGFFSTYSNVFVKVYFERYNFDMGKTSVFSRQKKSE